MGSADPVHDAGAASADTAKIRDAGKVDVESTDAATVDPPDVTPIAVCGDGTIDTGEVCDDGNTASGDGCSGDCASVECTGTGTFEDPTTHHCYKRGGETVARTAAVAACGREGHGYLVRWQDAQERDAVYTKMVGIVGGSRGRVWIGLASDGTAWHWDDGSVARDLNFRDGEPSGDGRCAEWGPENSLNDVPCDVSRDYVCEREPAGTLR